MRTRFHFLAALAVAALASCASSGPQPPAGMAYLRPQAQRGEMAKTFGGQAMIREINHRTVPLDQSVNGLALPPGRHAVVTSFSAERGTVLGHLSLGRVGDVSLARRSEADVGQVGAALQAEFDSIYQTFFEHQLTFQAEPGHRYKACVLDAGTGYRYWIEDETMRRVVAGSRNW